MKWASKCDHYDSLRTTMYQYKHIRDLTGIRELDKTKYEIHVCASMVNTIQEFSENAATHLYGQPFHEFCKVHRP